MQRSSRRRKSAPRHQKPRRRVLFFAAMLPSLLLLLIWMLLYRKIVIETVTRDSNKNLQSNVPLRNPPLSVRPNVHTNKRPKHQGAPEERPKLVKQPNKQQDDKPIQDDKSKQLHDEKQRHHAIPNILTFTHSVNLLESTNVTGENVALLANVQNTIQLHPGAQVHFLTDVDCIESIQRVLGEDSPLVQYFRQEKEGMYKADICRGAALYETGGLYFDVDIQARMSMFDGIEEPTTFVTTLVHRQSKYPNSFFQAFIGVSPQNPIMLKYLQLFIDYYQDKLSNIAKGPLGVLLLRKAYDEVHLAKGHQFSQHVQLWQEVLYNSRLFPKVPPPNWGTRRACHFVVVANRKSPFVVPLYSRCKGSRMCGGKESVRSLRGA